MVKKTLLETNDEKLAQRFKAAVEKFVTEMDACAETGLELSFNVGPKEQVFDDTTKDLLSTKFQVNSIVVKRIYNHI